MLDKEKTEEEEAIAAFYEMLAESQQDLGPEIAEAVYAKLWELYLD